MQQGRGVAGAAGAWWRRDGGGGQGARRQGQLGRGGGGVVEEVRCRGYTVGGGVEVGCGGEVGG